MTDDLQATGLAREDAPSLSDLATPEEGAGAWAQGWYRGTVLDGYATGRGKVMQTIDLPSKDALSRNLFICIAVNGDVFVPSDPNPAKRVLAKGPGGVRNIRATYNYRPSDFTPERIAAVKNARAQYKATQGAWPDADIQRSSLALGQLGQLEKAIGFKLPVEGGRINPAPFVKQQLDVRLTITVESEKQRGGFSEVAAVAASGSHVK
jgi:hypothetical protein